MATPRSNPFQEKLLLLSSADDAKDSALRTISDDVVGPKDPHLQLNAHIDMPMPVHDWARVRNDILVTV